MKLQNNKARKRRWGVDAGVVLLVGLAPFGCNGSEENAGSSETGGKTGSGGRSSGGAATGGKTGSGGAGSGWVSSGGANSGGAAGDGAGGGSAGEAGTGGRRGSPNTCEEGEVWIRECTACGPLDECLSRFQGCVPECDESAAKDACGDGRRCIGGECRIGLFCVTGG